MGRLIVGLLVFAALVWAAVKVEQRFGLLGGVS